MRRLDPTRVDAMLDREQQLFAQRHPASRAAFEAGQQHYLYGAPSHWMRRWAGGFPLLAREAHGTRVRCADGLDYVDFCLGDTGGMCGHGDPAITAAVAAQLARGTTLMLPTDDAAWVGAELARRFGLPYWGFTTSASDANRAAIRIARMVTGRERVLVFNGCYHGSVEEAHVALGDHGEVVLRNGIHPNAVDHARVSRVIEFNDVAALEAALAPGDVACVLAEPFMTNYGMIAPQPGFLDALRELTRRAGTLWIVDETHTLSNGPGGYTALHRLEPDFFVVGKAVGGGIPVGLSTDHFLDHGKALQGAPAPGFQLGVMGHQQRFGTRHRALLIGGVVVEKGEVAHQDTPHVANTHSRNPTSQLMASTARVKWAPRRRRRRIMRRGPGRRAPPRRRHR